MAFNSVLRRASKSFLPLAIRTVGSPRTFHRAIPTVISVENRTTLRNFLPFSHFSTGVTAQKPTADDDPIRVLETEIDCTKEPQDMKERKSGLRNESSNTKRIVLFQRITAALLLPLIIIYKKVSSIFLPLFLFRHINQGIEEIMADYVHQEMTRNWILVYLRLFLLIAIKDVFLSFV